MTLQGSLQAFSLTDIFQLLSFSMKSGALHLRGEGAATVYFENGEVYFATTKAGDTLGTALVRSGAVPEAIWKAAASEGRRLSAIGEVLVRERAVDADRLQSFLRERVEEAVFHLMRWDKGRFDFRAGERHAFGPVFTFPVDPLIAEGRRRLEEWAVITESIPSVWAAVQMIQELPEEHHEVTLTREEWRLLSAVDARRSITDLANLLGDGEFHTCQVLHGLLATGLISVLDRPAPDIDHPVAEIDDDLDDFDLDEADPVEPADHVEPVAPVEPVDHVGHVDDVGDVEDEPEVAEVAPDTTGGPPLEPVAEERFDGVSLADAAAALEEPEPAANMFGGDESALPHYEAPVSEPHGLAVSAYEAEAYEASAYEPPAEAPHFEAPHFETAASGFDSLAEMAALDTGPAPEHVDLAPSVSADLFRDLDSEPDLDSSRLGEVLAPAPTPITLSPAVPAEPEPVPSASVEPRMGSASIAREFGALATGPARTEGAHALEASALEVPALEDEPEAEPAEPEVAPPSPRSAGLNKTLILRLISGVKDL